MKDASGEGENFVMVGNTLVDERGQGREKKRSPSQKRIIRMLKGTRER